MNCIRALHSIALITKKKKTNEFNEQGTDDHYNTTIQYIWVCRYIQVKFHLNYLLIIISIGGVLIFIFLSPCYVHAPHFIRNANK